MPAEVMALRQRQAKNLCCLLLLANGIPMISAGDELLQTQGGNNNPYNQDNETTWLDWDRCSTHADHFRFVRRMIAFRKAHPTLCRSRFWRDDVRWYGVGPSVDMGDDSHSLALRPARGLAGRPRPLRHDQRLPRAAHVHGPGGPPGVLGARDRHRACRAPTTSSTPPGAASCPSRDYRVQARSVVVLVRRTALA